MFLQLADHVCLSSAYGNFYFWECRVEVDKKMEIKVKHKSKYEKEQK